ncbi:uncharacterized protein LOC134848116 [Symsagittifera roscoffensis]|uniref:uncharacterized protein LOC134848116 n=1 Tax=Symsagittifera roscoffensis TaxID=84072 RepID=UPI00307BD348
MAAAPEEKKMNEVAPPAYDSSHGHGQGEHYSGPPPAVQVGYGPPSIPQPQYNQGYQHSPVAHQPGYMPQGGGYVGPPVTVTVSAPNTPSTNQWQQSFCGCFDHFMICLASLCCWGECVFFCIAYYTKQTKLWAISFCLMCAGAFFNTLPYVVRMGDDWNPTSYMIFMSFCALVALGAAVARFVIFTAVRARLRDTYNIRGTLLEDCCFAYWCAPCTTCQMMAEVDHQLDLQGERTIFSRT